MNKEISFLPPQEMICIYVYGNMNLIDVVRETRAWRIGNYVSKVYTSNQYKGKGFRGILFTQMSKIKELEY